jgi:hypothetical protein
MPTIDKKASRGRPVRYLTETELAAELETEDRSLRRWREEGCPHQRRSGRILYRLPQVVEWLRERARKETDADEAKERARKMRADADRSEMLAAKLRAELAPVAQMDAAVERLASAVQAEVAGLRARFTLRLVGLKTPHEAALVLDDMAKQILTALAASAEQMAEGEDDMGDDDMEDAA